MEDLRQNNKLLWETRFFALSQISGNLEGYRGIFIEALTITDAMKSVRKMNAPYLYLTGDWYRDFESIAQNDSFHKPIKEKTLNVEKMSFDDFCDWLDNSLTLDDLLQARNIVKETVKTPQEHFKIIDNYIKKIQDGKDQKES